MSMRPLLLAALLLLPCAGAPAPADAQNILHPTERIEQLLRHEPFEIYARADTRFEGDRTQRVAMVFAGEEQPIAVKWARAPRGGQAFNNQPRYEIAAYEIQKLFLDEADYVVPPTVARLVPLELYREHDPAAEPTFGGEWGVLVALQYWLFNVSGRDVLDRQRLERDTAYARHFANANLMTYLIRHLDSNPGNLLVSTTGSPRVFAVDNGVSFRSRPGNVGTEWQQLHVRRLPASSVERLRRLTRRDLEGALAVVAQFEMVDGVPVQVRPGAPTAPRRGVRHDDRVVQLGLTRGEIGDVWRRLQRLLRDVDRGRYELF